MLNLCKRFGAIAALSVIMLLAACGYGGGGDMVSGPIVQSATLFGGQVTPSVLTSASGTSTVTVDMNSGMLSGSVVVSGITATGVTLNVGGVGSNGNVAATLVEQTPGSGTWTFPAGAALSADQVTTFRNGGIYANVATNLYPSGQIRGQYGLDVRTANLTSTQVTPPVVSAGSGNAILGINTVGLALSGAVTIGGLAATAVTINDGALGANGAVLVSLTETPAGSGNWVVPGGTVLSSAQLTSFQNGALYVNATSAANTAGALRGQVGRIVLDALMTSAQEVPGSASSAQATARAVIDPITRVLNGTFVTNGITATLAHIHTGAFGVASGVTYPFSQTTAGGNTWTMTQTTMTPTQYQTMLFGGNYANVHSAAFPAGEIRAQLGNIVRTGILTGAGEVPPNNSTAIGRIRVDINPATLDVTVNLATTGVTGTVAHIHQGSPGVVAGVAIPFTQVSSGVWAAAAPAKATLAQATAFAAGGTYANVHSAAFPVGEIRVQLTGTD